jgi:hypothetical protein
MFDKGRRRGMETDSKREGIGAVGDAEVYIGLY